MSRRLAIITVTATLACATARDPRVVADHEQILRVVIQFIEQQHSGHDGPVSTMLLSEGLDPATRQAAARLRPTTTSDRIPSRYIRPPGHLRVSRLVITGNTAIVEAGFGVVLKGQYLNCGDLYLFSLERSIDGTWRITSKLQVVC